MPFTTHQGPVRVGTVKEGSARNTGNLLLTQSATVAATVAKTSGAVAQALFTLPAGSKILRFRVEKTIAISGNSVSAVAATFGTSGTADAYMGSAALALTAIPTVQATIDAAMKPPATDNIGTADVTVYGTFTATTGNPDTGSIVVTVEYIQRAADGSQYPSGVTA